MDRRKDFNIGVIGMGAIGAVHAEVLLDAGGQMGLNLAATADARPRQIYPGVPHAGSYKSLLRNRSIDAISLCTPPDTHYRLAKEALKRGKDVMVEKPPALTLEQLQEMEELAERSGRVLFTAFHAAYSPEVKAAEMALREAEVRRIDVSYKEDHSSDDPGKWVFDPRRAGGGAMMDSGINAMSVVRRVLSGAGLLEVERARVVRAEGYKVETQGSVDFKADGIPGNLEIDWLFKGNEAHTLSFDTDKGLYVIDKTQGRLLHDGLIAAYGGEDPGLKTDTDQHAEYREVYRHFGELLRSRQSFVSGAELGFVIDVYRNGGKNRNVKGGS